MKPVEYCVYWLGGTALGVFIATCIYFILGSISSTFFEIDHIQDRYTLLISGAAGGYVSGWGFHKQVFGEKNRTKDKS